MGVEPFLLSSSSLLGVLAQRLVRKLCPAARGPSHRRRRPQRQRGPVRWHPVGCAECGHTGYKGRTGVYELMVADDAVRSADPQPRPESELVAGGARRRLRSMREDGERLVREGITSLEEVCAPRAIEMPAYKYEALDAAGKAADRAAGGRQRQGRALAAARACSWCRWP
jgi:general secretion pathway protein E